MSCKTLLRALHKTSAGALAAPALAAALALQAPAAALAATPDLEPAPAPVAAPAAEASVETEPPVIAQQSGTKQKGAKKTTKPAPAPAPVAPPAGNTGTTRTVIHTEAYKKREHLGPHLNVKVTPPEKRGTQGRVLVEIYNYSKDYLYSVDFWLYLYSDLDEEIEVHITADDIRPSWSALRWVQIPGKVQLPKITRVNLRNLSMFDDKARKVKLKHYIDLIKE